MRFVRSFWPQLPQQAGNKGVAAQQQQEGQAATFDHDEDEDEDDQVRVTAVVAVEEEEAAVPASPECECRWRWGGRSTAYDLELASPKHVGTAVRYRWSLGWGSSSVAWNFDVRTGTMSAERGDEHLLYEHVMQVTDRHGQSHKMLIVSHDSAPPSSPPLPQRATPGSRILCALVNRADGRTVDVTRYFACRHPRCVETAGCAIKHMIATRSLPADFLPPDAAVCHIAIIYGDLSEKVFSSGDPLFW